MHGKIIQESTVHSPQSAIQRAYWTKNCLWMVDCRRWTDRRPLAEKLKEWIDFYCAYVYVVVGVMGVDLFEQFAAMVERLPVRAVLSAVVLQRKMLEDDLAHNRTVPLDDVHSIIAFSEFLENAPETMRLSKTTVPIRHFGLYRATIKRLVEAGELPWESAGLFDAAFSAAGFEWLKAS
jgi:hypothetical protein